MTLTIQKQKKGNYLEEQSFNKGNQPFCSSQIPKGCVLLEQNLVNSTIYFKTVTNSCIHYLVPIQTEDYFGLEE